MLIEMNILIYRLVEDAKTTLISPAEFVKLAY